MNITKQYEINKLNHLGSNSEKSSSSPSGVLVDNGAFFGRVSGSTLAGAFFRFLSRISFCLMMRSLKAAVTAAGSLEIRSVSSVWVSTFSP